MSPETKQSLNAKLDSYLEKYKQEDFLVWQMKRMRMVLDPYNDDFNVPNSFVQDVASLEKYAGILHKIKKTKYLQSTNKKLKELRCSYNNPWDLPKLMDKMEDIIGQEESLSESSFLWDTILRNVVEKNIDFVGQPDWLMLPETHNDFKTHFINEYKAILWEKRIHRLTKDSIDRPLDINADQLDSMIAAVAAKMYKWKSYYLWKAHFNIFQIGDYIREIHVSPSSLANLSACIVPAPDKDSDEEKSETMIAKKPAEKIVPKKTVAPKKVIPKVATKKTKPHRSQIVEQPSMVITSTVETIPSPIQVEPARVITSHVEQFKNPEPKVVVHKNASSVVENDTSLIQEDAKTIDLSTQTTTRDILPVSRSAQVGKMSKILKQTQSHEVINQQKIEQLQDDINNGEYSLIEKVRKYRELEEILWQAPIRIKNYSHLKSLKKQWVLKGFAWVTNKYRFRKIGYPKNWGKNNSFDSNLLVWTPESVKAVQRISNLFQRKRGLWKKSFLLWTSATRDYRYNMFVAKADGSSIFDGSHAYGRWFDLSNKEIWYNWKYEKIGPKSLRLIREILIAEQSKWNILFVEESDHFHISVTDPVIRWISKWQQKTLLAEKKSSAQPIKTSMGRKRDQDEVISNKEYDSKVSIMKKNPWSLRSGIKRTRNKYVTTNWKKVLVYKKGDEIVFTNDVATMKRMQAINKKFETPMFQWLLKELILTLEWQTTIINGKNIILTRSYLEDNMTRFSENLKLMVETFYNAESQWKVWVINSSSWAAWLFQWKTNNFAYSGKSYLTNSYETGLNGIQSFLADGFQEKLSPVIKKVVDRFMLKDGNGWYKRINKKTNLKPNIDVKNGWREEQMVLSLLYTFAYKGNGKYGNKEELKNKFLAQAIHGWKHWMEWVKLFYDKLHHTDPDPATHALMKYQMSYYKVFTKKVATDNAPILTQALINKKHKEMLVLVSSIERLLNDNDINIGRVEKKFQENLIILANRVKKKKWYSKDTQVAQAIVKGLQKARSSVLDRVELMNLILERWNNWEINELLKNV